MVDGFLIIDKPAGITSHDVVNRVRRILNTRKVGHTGTLDPFATGVLPIAVGEGTKAIPFLDEGEKGYDATLRLGVNADTLDYTGTVLREADSSTVSSSDLLSAIGDLTGEISQVPPMFSAIKQGGQPLYKLARKGVEVERAARQVTIHRFELLEFTPPLARVRVLCSRGTYIRTLADDLGNMLGCGACLTELRRTSSGGFDLASSVSLERLAELAAEGRVGEAFQSSYSALAHLPELMLDGDEAARLRNGIAPRRSDLQLPHGLLRLTYDGRLLAVGNLAGGSGLSLKRVFL